MESYSPVTSNPWNILPVKNAKYAFNCTEVHLSNRNLEVLKNFEAFKNLEVLYLNHNKLRKFEGLNANFRIKHLYIEHNNLVTLAGSIPKLKFLSTLLVGNNNLRNLSSVLEVLKKCASLEILNLAGNPCAEEPYYRHRVVQAIPSLKVLDRHEVTEVEKFEAERTVRKLNAAVTQPKKTKPKVEGNTMSTGERDLAREVKQIHLKQLQLKTEEEAKEAVPKFSWDTYRGKPLPTSTGVLQTRAKFGAREANRLNEWEKNWLKELFVKYDRDKSGFVDISEFPSLLEELKQNSANIGKVPVQDIESLLTEIKQWPKSKENKVHWKELKLRVDNWTWSTADSSALQAQIEAHYAKAQKLQLNGKLQEAKAEALKALRLEGLTSHHQSVKSESLPTLTRNIRTDTFLLRTVVPGGLKETQVDLTASIS